MRLHPIVFGMGRRTPAPAVLAGYHVPPGSIVYYAAALAVGQADQFPQPEVSLHLIKTQRIDRCHKAQSSKKV